MNSIRSCSCREDFRHSQPAQSLRDAHAYVPDLATMVTPSSSQLREMVERFFSDRDALMRFYSVPGSSLQLKRLKEFYEAWQARLEDVPYESLEVDGRIDWHLLKGKLKHLLVNIDLDRIRNSEIEPILPIFESVAHLQEKRRLFESIDAEAIASTLVTLNLQLVEAQKSLVGDNAVTKSIALRAANRMSDLHKTLADWFAFYDGYDPAFSWWVRTPYMKLTETMKKYERFLREEIVGAIDPENEPIVGDPVGADGLTADLEFEMIPYTPAELIAMAEKELAWCMVEWKKVSEEMGLGDDWKTALKYTMRDHLSPGEQPELIAYQAYEAIEFVLKRDLLTVPPLAIDVWRMTMMSPQAQKTNPFFLGGERLQISFPTDSMDQNDKLSSLRANNIHLARCTVHHELIPGHHLQMFCMERHNPHRKMFGTPFWIEGWALWWEFLLWDLGFPETPENRAGMLFWRTHRCARIVFSLNFHIGKWTPQECIDYLVEQVGHDKHTATGEVRRSFNGNYPPLYQAAYMIGAIQVRALHAELVSSGSVTLKEFHDRFMQGNMMPIEMVRASIGEKKLPRDYKSSWKFSDVNI